MKIRILILLFIFTTAYCSGQTNSDSIRLKEKLILTESQNDKWIDSLSRLTSSLQLKFIVDRLMLDSNVYVRSRSDRIKLSPLFQSTKFQGCCKPTIIMNGIFMNFYFDDKNSYIQMLEEVSKFSKLLNVISIDDISIISKEKAGPLFGPQSEDGVIVLSITNAKSLKVIKKIYGSSK
ncbi:MAG: hypothetical protein KAY50_02280 [Chitinophagaceae bacterium]|nr:hypothetical protein [Chitinophagaceae bacterium]